MNPLGTLTSNKIFYVIAGIVALLVFLTVIIIISRVGGGGGGAEARLEMWGVFDTRQDFTEIFKNLKTIAPGIKINYTQYSYEDYERALVNALAAGEGPDIFMIHHTWLPKHGNKLAPMPVGNYLNVEKKEVPFLTVFDFENQFVEVVNKDLISEGKIYGIPLFVDTLALFYNRDMFNTAGIVRPPRDWNEFNEDVKLLSKHDSEGNLIQAGAAMGTSRNINRSTDILSALMVQNGTQMNGRDNISAAFTKAVNGQRVGENALEYYTDFSNLEKEVFTWNDDEHYSIDAFIEQKVAMMFAYSYQIPLVQTRFSRLNFGIAPLPQFSELDAKNYANYWALGVSSGSKNQNAAWQFLNYLASRGGITPYLNATFRPSARRDLIDLQRDDLKLGVFAVQALSAKSWRQIDNVAIDQILADMIDEVNQGKTSIRSALRAAESKINTLVNR